MEEIIDVNTLFGPMPAASADITADALLDLMQKHLITAACTLSTLGMLLDPTGGNGATRAACGDHPELLPAATLNPMMYFGDDTVTEGLRANGFCLVRFFPRQQGWPSDFAPFHDLLKAIVPTGLPVMVDVDSSGDITSMRRALEGIQAPVILSRVDSDLLSEAVCVLKKTPNWNVEISRLLSPGCIKILVDQIGADRVIFGTGAPSRPIASAVQTLNFSGVDAASRRKILSENARRILALA